MGSIPVAAALGLLRIEHLYVVGYLGAVLWLCASPVRRVHEAPVIVT